MKNVNILPPEVISKIAAGEVIERPASVVKELLENSLDAQTKSIELHLKQAGKSSIHIKDTGNGIDYDDIETIFLRHSTSKITNIGDLFAIDSLGFRGEALYSIAAISDVILRTKTKSADTGWQIHLRGGKKLDLRPISMTQGTEIEIKELFFNTPARRKFLKTTTTELNQILNIFLPYTILYPSHKFILTHNNRTLTDLAPHSSLTQRVCNALNLKEDHLLENQAQIREKNISVRLILGDINIRRARKDMQFFFINNRPVQCYNLSFHMNQAYRSIFPQDTYPFFAVYIDIPKEDVDVNAHPTKKEVKIKDDYSLASFLRSVCEKTLLSKSDAKQIKEIFVNPTPSTYTEKTQTVEETDTEAPTETPHKQYILNNDYQNFSVKEDPLPTVLEETFSPKEPPQIEITQKNNLSLKDKLSTARYIGSFIKKYLFFETPYSLLVIDQHAAQERVTYENLIKQINSNKLEIQHLLTPLTLRLTPQEFVVWEVIKDELEKIGFSTTLWDNENIALHTYPNLLQKSEIAVRNLLSGEERSRFDADTLARRACRNSLMTGYEIDTTQARYLRDQLIKCKDPFICPHGRPTVVEIQEKVLNKQFLR
jgi:DNA mismatch repair protein MutL